MVTRDSDGRNPQGSASENRENSQNPGRCNFKELYWPSSKGDQPAQPSIQPQSQWLSKCSGQKPVGDFQIPMGLSVLGMLHWNSMEKVGENHLIPPCSSPPEHRIVLPACFWQWLCYCVSGRCPCIPSCQSSCGTIQSQGSLWHSGFKHRLICIIAGFRNMSICR